MKRDFNTAIFAHTDLLEFRFLSLESDKKGYYQVMVKDSFNRPHFFKMEEVEGSWKIAHCNKKPRWICDLEDQLSAEIIKRLTTAA